MQPRKDVSLSEAAKLTGKDKSTISKRLAHKDERKRIVGYKDKNDAWVISIASLCTHYKIPTENLNKIEQDNATPAILNSPLNSTPRNSEFNSNSTPEIIELRAEVKFLNKQVELQDEQLKDTKKTAEDLRNDRDHWKDSAKQAQETVTRQTYLLEHHQKATETPVETQEDDLSSQGYKNDSMGFYELLTAFIVLLAVVTVIIMTREMWIPFIQSLLNR